MPVAASSSSTGPRDCENSQNFVLHPGETANYEGHIVTAVNFDSDTLLASVDGSTIEFTAKGQTVYKNGVVVYFKNAISRAVLEDSTVDITLCTRTVTPCESDCCDKLLAPGETIIYEGNSIKITNFDSSSAILDFDGYNMDFSDIGQLEVRNGVYIYFYGAKTWTDISQDRILLKFCKEA